jgi:hypothetical protein
MKSKSGSCVHNSFGSCCGDTILCDAGSRRVKAMVQHLQAERTRLLGEVSALEQANDGLKSQLAKTKERASQQERVRPGVVPAAALCMYLNQYELCRSERRWRAPTGAACRRWRP